MHAASLTLSFDTCSLQRGKDSHLNPTSKAVEIVACSVCLSECTRTYLHCSKEPLTIYVWRSMDGQKTGATRQPVSRMAETPHDGIIVCSRSHSRSPHPEAWRIVRDRPLHTV